MNPILPPEHFVPDGEPRVFDGRFYVYGSYDISGRDDYCSDRYHVFSSEDLVNWTDHGVAFCTDQGVGAMWQGTTLFAPDCVERDGLYYLYFCTSDRGEGVAISNSPAGPFRNPQPISIAHGTSIDPSVFIDDDGQAYYYWSQHRSRGARLLPNMRDLDPASLNNRLISEEEHGFHEGSSMRKIGDWYYFIYADSSRIRPTCISYAMGRSPLGPFEKKGVIIDNAGCDPQTWNNHGSIQQFQGAWYVVYHRSSQNSIYNRRACIERIEINPDGTIDEVEMTTQGVEGPIDPAAKMEAWRACYLTGGAYITPRDDGEALVMPKGTTSATFRYYDFARPFTRMAITLRGKPSRLTLRADTHTLGTLSFAGSRRWSNVEVPVETPHGVFGLHVLAQGDDIDILSFAFD